MSPQSQDGRSDSSGVGAPFYVDPRTLTGLPLNQIVARVAMLEDALRESEDRLRFLVDAVTEYAIFTLDPDGVIESWNTGAERMKGYTHDEALGHHFSMLYTAEDRDAGLPAALLDRARADGSHEHNGWQVKKGGMPYWSHVVISVLKDDRGSHIGFVKIVRDLTEQHRLEVAQDSFFNAFKHEVRRPITAVQGFAELLADAEPENHERFVERVESNATLLLSMVEELVDFAKLRSGSLPISLEVVDLRSLAQLAVANLAPAGETSRVRVDTTTSVKVLADPAALERVVANLVVNSLRRSPAHGDVSLTCESLGEVGVLRIVDQGTGADERDLDAIFLDFERDRGAHDHDLGAGLGLASVQRLIGLQGGTVGMSSQDDVGTTVTIRLPIAPDPAPSISEALRASRRRDQVGTVLGRFDDLTGRARTPSTSALRDAAPKTGPLAALLRLLMGMHLAPPERLSQATRLAGEALGVELHVLLIDYEQEMLHPLDDTDAGPDAQLVDSTLAGQCFRSVRALGHGSELWVPLIDGVERLGVVHVRTKETSAEDPVLQQQCLWLGKLIGHLVVDSSAYGDGLDAIRRTDQRPASAELIWNLLPPLTAGTELVMLAAMMHPVYGLGGDAFDYDISESTVRLAIFDATGHNLGAGLTVATALSAYRGARHNGSGLLEQVMAVDEAVMERSSTGEDFVTGVLADLDLRSGELRYVLAGHPPPLLLRDGRLIKRLDDARRPLLGLGYEGPEVGTEMLEAGDWLLFYTDGITEGRDRDGRFFGEDRLVDFLRREIMAGQPPPETVRRLSRAILKHQGGEFQDDATVLLVQWTPTADEKTSSTGSVDT